MMVKVMKNLIVSLLDTVGSVAFIYQLPSLLYYKAFENQILFICI